MASGQFFRQATGERFTAIDCSDFHLLGRFAAGDDITDVLAQRRDCGFNMRRVFTLYNLEAAGIGWLVPCPYDLIPTFCALCASYGSYVQFVAYTSTFDPRHWERLTDSLQGVTNALVSLVNEEDQPVNRLPDEQVFSRVPWLLCSHGSNGADQHPVDPIWDYGEYHSNGLPEFQRKVGHNAMELSKGPMMATENTRYPDKDSSPIHAYDAAAGAALLSAGACFHSVNGKRSQLWVGRELECAEAWAAGARSVPLEFQDGAYVHATNEEGPGILRAYKRVLPGRAWTVLIRK